MRRSSERRMKIRVAAKEPVVLTYTRTKMTINRANCRIFRNSWYYTFSLPIYFSVHSYRIIIKLKKFTFLSPRIENNSNPLKNNSTSISIINEYEVTRVFSKLVHEGRSIQDRRGRPKFVDAAAELLYSRRLVPRALRRMRDAAGNVIKHHVYARGLYVIAKCLPTRREKSEVTRYTHMCAHVDGKQSDSVQRAHPYIFAVVPSADFRRTFETTLNGKFGELEIHVNEGGLIFSCAISNFYIDR